MHIFTQPSSIFVHCTITYKTSTTTKKTPAEAGVASYGVLVKNNITVSKIPSLNRVPFAQDMARRKAWESG